MFRALEMRATPSTGEVTFSLAGKNVSGSDFPDATVPVPVFNREFIDEARKLRILRFLHTHSHGDTVGEPEHNPSLLGEANSVLQDLLDLIKDQDPDHFAAMVSLVDLGEDDEGTLEAAQ